MMKNKVYMLLEAESYVFYGVYSSEEKALEAKEKSLFFTEIHTLELDKIPLSAVFKDHELYIVFSSQNNKFIGAYTDKKKADEDWLYYQSKFPETHCVGLQDVLNDPQVIKDLKDEDEDRKDYGEGYDEMIEAMRADEEQEDGWR